MMKKMKILWALLPVAVSLIVASCGSEDATDPTSGNNSGTKTIPVTITVGMDNATRATVGDDNSSLYFQTGDKLAVLYSGAQIALLNNTSIAEGSASATFQGNMTVSNAAESYGEVTVVLIGQNNVGVRENSSYQWNNDSHAICVANGNSTALNEAVKKYSYLTGTGPFNPAGQNNFTLTQHTAFLNFYVTFKDGTTANTNLSVIVTNNNSTIGSGSVTTTTEATNNDVIANFVVPVAAGTVMNGATIEFTNKDPITLSTTATLAGQSYKIEKTIGGPQAPAGVQAVQLWEGGPYWATMNVGASSLEEYGDYFAWGETDGYAADEPHNFWFFNEHDENDLNPYYKFARVVGSSSYRLTKYVTKSGYGYDGYTDNLTSLLPEDDAAAVNWGNGWRMPTRDEVLNLSYQTVVYYLNTKYSDGQGHEGYGILITGKQEGYTNKSIFLPAVGDRLSDSGVRMDGTTGYYWLSDLNTTYCDAAYCMYFDNRITSGSKFKQNQNVKRAAGFAVRPVRDTPLP